MKKQFAFVLLAGGGENVTCRRPSAHLTVSRARTRQVRVVRHYRPFRRLHLVSPVVARAERGTISRVAALCHWCLPPTLYQRVR